MVLFSDNFLQSSKAIPKDALEGSQTTIYCAISEEMEGVSGKFLADCQDQGIQTKATSEEDVEQFWQLRTQRMTLVL